MGEKEIGEFITHLAKNEKVSASTQNQALCAILFCYKNLLNINWTILFQFIGQKDRRNFQWFSRKTKPLKF